MCSTQPPSIELEHGYYHNHKNLPDGGIQDVVAVYSTVWGTEEYPVEQPEYMNVVDKNSQPQVVNVTTNMNASSNDESQAINQSDEVGPIYAQPDQSKKEKHSPLMNNSESTNESPPLVPSRPAYEVEFVYDEPDLSEMKKNFSLINTSESTDESPLPIPAS